MFATKMAKFAGSAETNWPNPGHLQLFVPPPLPTVTKCFLSVHFMPLEEVLFTPLIYLVKVWKFVEMCNNIH
jgi:hypothetical protein